MPALQPVRGTQDLLPDEQRRHRAVTDTARAIAERYGYHEIATPIFEFTEVFARPIGETSDIVTKEMYTFADRGGEEVTLRPEYTAGIIRAVISNGLTQALPLRFFASGPMFRYERPQKGRFRQFHQIDVELIGLAQPQADVEVIALGADILDALGVLPRTVLELNTLGDGREPARLSRGAARLLPRAPRPALRRQPGAAGAQSAAHPRFQGRGRPPRQRRGAVLRRVPHRRGARLLRRGARRARPARHRLSREPAPGARPRLLLPHRLRVRHHRSGRARHRARRRPL